MKTTIALAALLLLSTACAAGAPVEVQPGGYPDVPGDLYTDVVLPEDCGEPEPTCAKQPISCDSLEQLPFMTGRTYRMWVDGCCYDR